MGTHSTSVAATATPNAVTAPATASVGADSERREGQGPDRRHNRVDRRAGVDRRRLTAEQSGYTGPERRSGKERRDDTGLERRRGPGRRRSDDRRVAEEGEMNTHQFEFVMAVEAYKKVNKRLYPTWTEILEVLHQLGYRKVTARNINLDNVPQPTLTTPDRFHEPLVAPQAAGREADDDEDEMGEAA